jgi:hypothetical protein
MSGTGVLFALSTADDGHLRSLPDARARVGWVAKDIEERWDKDWLLAIDTLWFPVHYCLHGSSAYPLPGASPEAKAIFGGEPLGMPKLYTIDYKSPLLTASIAKALGFMRDDAIWARAGLVERKDYQGPREENLQLAVVEAVHDLARFYRSAADAGRAVIFTVDM